LKRQPFSTPDDNGSAGVLLRGGSLFIYVRHPSMFWKKDKPPTYWKTLCLMRAIASATFGT